MAKKGSRLAANPHKDEAGYITSKPNELSGSFCVLYDAKQAGFEASNGRWAVFCAAHGVILAHKNKKTATSLLREPQRWCNACKDMDDLQHAEHVLTLRHARCDDEQIRLWAKLARGNPEKVRLFEDIYGMKPDEFLDYDDE